MNNRDWLSIKQTSILLQCDSAIINTMLEANLLEATIKKGVSQIKKGSVLAFRQRYLPLQQLAISFKLGVKALITLCSKNELMMLSVKRKFNGNQTFMEKSDVKVFANHVKEY